MVYHTDCGKCKKEVLKAGIQCQKCSDWLHLKCVDLPNFVPKSLTNPGVFFFCEGCRQQVIQFLGISAGKKGGVILVDKKDKVKSVDQSGVGSVGQVCTSSLGQAGPGVGSVGQAGVCSIGQSGSVDIVGAASSVGIAKDEGTVDSRDISNDVRARRYSAGDVARDSVDIVGMSGGTVGKVGVIDSQNLEGSGGAAGRDEGSWTTVNRKGSNRYDRELYIAGDSIVRHQGKNFGNKIGQNNVRSVCIPGGKIDHVGNAVKDIGRCKNVVISVGTNEIGRLGYVGITEKYISMFEDLKAKNSKNVVIVGILPRLFEKSEWFSRALGINIWLEQQCVIYNFTYLDLWDTLYNNRYYYSRDGVHLNFQGRAFFTEVISNKIVVGAKNFLGRR